jgi:hypothetical protein
MTKRISLSVDPQVVNGALSKHTQMRATNDVGNTNTIHNEKKFNYVKFWCDLNVIIRIEYIFCSFIGV